MLNGITVTTCDIEIENLRKTYIWISLHPSYKANAIQDGA